MGLTYFKRYRMEFDLARRAIPSAELPPDYHLIPWDASLLEAHAESKYVSFRGEIDSSVFTCLGELDGCSRLMTEIVGKQGFLPEATWLAAYRPRRRTYGRHAADNISQWPGLETVGDETGEDFEYCGTIQGLVDRSGMGAVQNLGTTPAHRGRGLGRCLLLEALAGFRGAGLRRAFLEVTARNEGAIRLYQRIGFTKVRTIFKAVEAAYT